MNRKKYWCLGFATFKPEQLSRYYALHKDHLELLKKKSRNISYFSLPIGRGENFFMDLLLEVRTQDKHAQVIDYIPVTYSTKLPHIICDPEWIEEKTWEGTLRVCNKTSALSFQMEVPTSILLPKVKAKKQYYCTVACYAHQIEIFSSEEAFGERFGGWDVQSVAYPPTATEAQKELIINGYLRYADMIINLITEMPFYHLIVESMGQSYHVYADAANFSEPPKPGAIISACGLMNGFLGAEAKGKTQQFTCTEPLTPAKFDFTVKHMLEKLRDISYESFTVDVSEMHIGHMQYVQTIKRGRKYIVEVGMRNDGRIYLFQSKKKSPEEALRIFETVLIDARIPDLSRWKDISKII